MAGKGTSVHHSLWVPWSVPKYVRNEKGKETLPRMRGCHSQPKGLQESRNLPCVTHGGSTAIEFEIPDMLLLVRRGLKRSTGKGKKYRRRAPGKYLIHV